MCRNRAKKVKKLGAKPKTSPRPKNRYYLGAKLSEYKFLKILRGFAQDASAKTLALETGISEKTIRAVYRQLREKLIEAAIRRPKTFGGAGHYLMRRGKLERQGKRFLEAVAESDLFADHVKRHAPRLETIDDAKGLLFETSIRVFCNISMQEGALIDYPEETKQALRTMNEISAWIKENRYEERFLIQYADLIARFGEITEVMPRLLEKEELLSLRNQSCEHRYPWNLLYDDLRRYLLKSPITAGPSVN